MPLANYIASGFTTAAGAGSAIATVTPGDTFTVQQPNAGSKVWLDHVWVQGAVMDWFSIKSARMHDANQGIRMRTGGLQQKDLLPGGIVQQMYPVDSPTVTLDATGAGSVAISVVYRYDDLGGSSPRLAGWNDISSRIKAISGVDVLLGAAAAVGTYSAGVAINSTFDNFQANADYALLGYLIPVAGLSLSIVGQDTGNLRAGGPMSTDPAITANWFVQYAENIGVPAIPIINANNKGSTLVSQVANSAIAAQTVTLIMAELQ
jgi:hypothetical protein